MKVVIVAKLKIAGMLSHNNFFVKSENHLRDLFWLMIEEKDPKGLVLSKV